MKDDTVPTLLPTKDKLSKSSKINAILHLPNNTIIELGDKPKVIGRTELEEYLNSLRNIEPNVVSKQHFTIFNENEKFYIQDGKTTVQYKPSTNHTFLNGVNITEQGKKELKSGAKINLANAIQLEFHLDNKDPVLFISDSEAIINLMGSFLKKLGYLTIHSAKIGQKGIEKFQEMLNGKKLPIVFLDLNLPDMNALSIFSQLIKLNPSTKVIITTAMGFSDDEIRQLIAAGVYQYMQKPIRFEKLKEIIQVIETESETTESISEDYRKSIDVLLNSSTYISLERLSQYTNTETSKVLSHLEKLVSEGKVIRTNDTREVSCNTCGSVKVAESFFCPSCKKNNFMQGQLIEHYNCGNVSIADSYKNDICPKCHKKIEVLGVNYKVLDNYYICNDCDEKFDELQFYYQCLKCDSKFKLEQAIWKTSPNFKPIK